MGSELPSKFHASYQPRTAGAKRSRGSAARRMTCWWITGALLAALTSASSALAFGLKDVVNRAQQLAAQPYLPPAEAPRFMREIGYDQYRGIRHQAQHNLWRDVDSRFQVSPVMPGGVYKHTVPINEVTGSTIRRVPFRKQHFTFDEAEFGTANPRRSGICRLRAELLLRSARLVNESFSYSPARATSVVLAREDSGDSRFEARQSTPDSYRAKSSPTSSSSGSFVHDLGQRRMTVYALLNSPRLTGAYEFVISPGTGH